MKRLRLFVLFLTIATLFIACRTGEPIRDRSDGGMLPIPDQTMEVEIDDGNDSITQLLANLPPAPPDKSAFPVTVENCDRSLTFTQPPQRVIGLWQPPNELLLALGAQAQIIGFAGNYTALPPALAKTAAAVPELGDATRWPSREILLTQNPDLVISEGLDGFAFDPSQGYATVAELEQAGIQVISTGSSCNPLQAATRGIDAVYGDLRLLAQIFGISSRGEALIERLQQRQAQITQRVRSHDPVPTIFYNGGEGPLAVLTAGIWGDMVRQAGGENIFDETVFQVGLEDFANSAAEVILMGTYPGQDPGEMAAFLTATFPDLPAVQHNRLYPIPTIETEAGIRVMDGLGRIARALHPEAFE